jgi:putative transposase
VKGRKRHILVDTNGFLLKVLVHAADVSESEGGIGLLAGIGSDFPRLRHLWADGGYFKAFVEWVKHELGWTVDIVKRPHKLYGDYAQLVRDFIGDQAYAERYAPGFRLLPRRWVVERTFAWLGKRRRLSKDYELLPETSETWIYLSMARLMLRRLAS